MNETGLEKRKIPVGVLALAIWVSVAASPWAARTGMSVTENALRLTFDTLKTDPETGLAVDDQWMLVKAQCTACHSSKLILQSHFSREKWLERIRWMQQTQKLWDLGASEAPILAYLVKHYGPVERTFDGRREPLPSTIWSPVQNER